MHGVKIKLSCPKSQQRTLQIYFISILCIMYIHLYNYLYKKNTRQESRLKSPHIFIIKTLYITFYKLDHLYSLYIKNYKCRKRKQKLYKPHYFPLLSVTTIPLYTIPSTPLTLAVWRGTSSRLKIVESVSLKHLPANQ